MARRSLYTRYTTGSLLVAVAAAVTTIGAWAVPNTPVTFAKVTNIPSHNGRYLASLVPAPGARASFGSTAWTIQVRTTAGSPVDSATLTLEGWMPDDSAAAALHPRVTRALGDGRYHVEPMRLDRRGWWNIKLEVRGSAGTDSLAFNIIR